MFDCEIDKKSCRKFFVEKSKFKGKGFDNLNL